MRTIEYQTIDKSEWGAGPWQSEPDKKQWQDPETGLPCLIVRGPPGALCGYGGLTFAGSCAHGEDPSEGICHIPGEGQPDNVWWLGFDCAHYMDHSPAYAPRRRWAGGAGAYRTQAYVEAQVASLARQLSEASAPAAASPQGDA